MEVGGKSKGGKKGGKSSDAGGSDCRNGVGNKARRFGSQNIEKAKREREIVSDDDEDNLAAEEKAAAKKAAAKKAAAVGKAAAKKAAVDKAAAEKAAQEAEWDEEWDKIL